MKNKIRKLCVAAFLSLATTWSAATGMLACEGTVDKSSNIDMSRRPLISIDLFVENGHQGTLVTDSDFPGQLFPVELLLTASSISVKQERIAVHEGYVLELGHLVIARQSGRFTMMVKLVDQKTATPEASVVWHGRCTQALQEPLLVPG